MGLERILNKINQEASENCELILSEAKKSCEEIAEEYRLDAQRKSDEIEFVAQEKIKSDINTIKSDAEILCKRKELSAKKQLSDNMVKTAYEHLCKLDDNAYFEVFARLLKLNAHKNENGEILLNEKDKKRITDNFLKILSGYKLIISSENRQIDAGFILKYENIEENCTFSAIFKEKKDQISDAVNKILFSQ